MPQDPFSSLPSAGRVNPEAERARARHLGWVLDLGLVTGAEAARRYRGWLLPELAAHVYPRAAGADLDLVTDAVCLAVPLGDQFQGTPRGQPERVARLCTELAAIPYREPGARPGLDLPVTRGWADVWRRAAPGMSPAWRARAADGLTRYFRSFLLTAQTRHLGFPLGEDAYLALRRQAGITAPCFALIERAGHFEVPAGAYWSRELRALTRCAADVVLLCDEVHGAGRAEALGDPHNLLLLRERAQGCSRPEAAASVLTQAAARAQRFQELSGLVPALCERWRLDGDRARAVRRYVAGLRHWMSGSPRWSAATARYREGAGPAAAPVSPGRGGALPAQRGAGQDAGATTPRR